MRCWEVYFIHRYKQSCSPCMRLPCEEYYGPVKEMLASDKVAFLVAITEHYYENDTPSCCFQQCHVSSLWVLISSFCYYYFLSLGILHKGNGENQFISQQPPVIGSIMGNGRRRSISCPSCNGLADGNKLLAPVALTCGSDGSLYVGDFNYIRRIFPSGNVTNILELRYIVLHVAVIITQLSSAQSCIPTRKNKKKLQ